MTLNKHEVYNKLKDMDFELSLVNITEEKYNIDIIDTYMEDVVKYSNIQSVEDVFNLLPERLRPLEQPEIVEVQSLEDVDTIIQPDTHHPMVTWFSHLGFGDYTDYLTEDNEVPEYLSSDEVMTFKEEYSKQLKILQSFGIFVPNHSGKKALLSKLMDNKFQTTHITQLRFIASDGTEIITPIEDMINGHYVRDFFTEYCIKYGVSLFNGGLHYTKSMTYRNIHVDNYTNLSNMVNAKLKGTSPYEMYPISTGSKFVGCKVPEVYSRNEDLLDTQHMVEFMKYVSVDVETNDISIHETHDLSHGTEDIKEKFNQNITGRSLTVTQSYQSMIKFIQKYCKTFTTTDNARPFVHVDLKEYQDPHAKHNPRLTQQLSFVGNPRYLTYDDLEVDTHLLKSDQDVHTIQEKVTQMKHQYASDRTTFNGLVQHKMFDGFKVTQFLGSNEEILSLIYSDVLHTFYSELYTASVHVQYLSNNLMSVSVIQDKVIQFEQSRVLELDYEIAISLEANQSIGQFNALLDDNQTNDTLFKQIYSQMVQSDYIDVYNNKDIMIFRSHFTIVAKNGLFEFSDFRSVHHLYLNLSPMFEEHRVYYHLTHQNDITFDFMAERRIEQHSHEMVSYRDRDMRRSYAQPTERRLLENENVVKILESM